jgi:hypothetical protein
MDWLFRIFDWRRMDKLRHPRNGPVVGYGPVDHWFDVDPRTWTALHAEHGVPVVHIEFFGWAQGHQYDDPGKAIKAWKALRFWCQRRRLVLLVSVCNDNKGSGKYGDDNRHLAEFRPQITRAIDEIAKDQWGGLLVQPVGETQTPAGQDIERECAARFPASMLVYNGNGGRPSSAGGWGFAAWHAPHLASAVPRGHIAVTDHSTILGELGGLYAEHYDPAKVEAYARRMIQQGSSCVVYGFAHTKPDEGSLKALARA